MKRTAAEAAKLDMVLEMIVDLVAARLGARAAAPEQTFYSTRALPHGVSRRRFHELVKALPGAVKEGRTWRIECDVWHASRRPAARAPTPREIAMRALESAGYRRIGK